MTTMEPEKLVALQRAVVLRDMVHEEGGSWNHGADYRCLYVTTRNPELCNCRNVTNVDLLIELAKQSMVDTRPGRA